jgi:hypothetical protein
VCDGTEACDDGKLSWKDAVGTGEVADEQAGTDGWVGKLPVKIT